MLFEHTIEGKKCAVERDQARASSGWSKFRDTFPEWLPLEAKRKLYCDCVCFIMLY